MERNAAELTVQREEQEIDLWELFLYICRRWRSLVILVLVGAALGLAFGLVKSANYGKNLDLDELHLPQIEQYARYVQMYEEQEAYEAESVYLNLEPDAVYQGSVRYYLRLQASDSLIVGQRYNAILRDNSVIEALVEASGLSCTPRAVQELVSVTFRELDRQEQLLSYEDYPLTVEILAKASGPSAESSQKMLNVLEEAIEQANSWAVTSYGAQELDRLTEASARMAYDAGVISARNASTEKLAEYSEQISALEKNLTDDDKVYYQITWEPDEPVKSGLAKWIVIFAALLGVVGVAVYAVTFVMDGNVKNPDDLLGYGLYPLAALKGVPSRKKRCALDRLFEPRREYQTDEYLVGALAALGADKPLVCGDLEDPDVRALAERLGDLLPGAVFAASMTANAHSQAQAKAAGSVVLTVHLWKTRRADLEQELRICRELGVCVDGVVVIG